MTLELPEQQRTKSHLLGELAVNQSEESAQLAAYAREHGLANLCRVLYNFTNLCLWNKAQEYEWQI